MEHSQVYVQPILNSNYAKMVRVHCFFGGRSRILAFARLLGRGNKWVPKAAMVDRQGES